jgi:hypothetical protein
MRIINLIIVISMILATNIQEIKPIDLPELDNNNKIIEQIIDNPDTLISLINLDRKKMNFSNINYDYFNSMAEKIKINFRSGYRFIYSELFIQLNDSNLFKKSNIKAFYDNDKNFYDANHIVQIGSLSTGKRITFTFTRDFKYWTLNNVSILYPGESPTVENVIMRTREKGNIPTLDSNDNCRLYIDDNYKAISKLLNNSDSLYKLISNICSKYDLKDWLKNSSTFAEFCDYYKKGYYVCYDQVFEADNKFKKDSITIFNEIKIKTNNANLRSIPFYFMKKNGIWQYYDKELKNFSTFP